MNTELFIARRLFSDKNSGQKFSGRVVKLAVAGISLGLAVMIISVCIIIGFQREVKGKVNGFASHLKIVNNAENNSYQTQPIIEYPDFIEKLQHLSGIRHVQKFITKPGMIKTKESIQGVVLKGISSDFDWSFFNKYKISGEKFSMDSVDRSSVWISQQLSDLLKIKQGDRFLMYFLNQNERYPRIRRFKVCGIYRTGLDEFDKLFVLSQLSQIQQINSWKNNQISGYEIFISDPDNLDGMDYDVQRMMASFFPVSQNNLQLTNIKNKYPEIYDWLNLLDMNVWIILILMIIVAGFNMISGLFVIILERTQMIGIMKYMGATNANVRKIFLYLSAFLVGRGLLWGNIIGIGLCLIQYFFNIIHLDPVSYYVSTVPVYFPIFKLILLNIGTLLITVLMLVIPSYFVAKISPDRIIRFD
ncbi:MAG: ABC transporter permease [Prolixibacteraceae bacterium]|nr:ABC transporter permease [Prolixibacteraceae bacterium]